MAEPESVKRLLVGPSRKRDQEYAWRLGAITDVSDAAFFLCSEAAAFGTGVTLVVDGGLWLASRRVAGEWNSL